MPTYDYKCKNCNWTGEFFESIKANPRKKCPECGKLKLQRLISKETGQHIIFKGDGFYRSIDYINQKAKEDGMTTSKRRKHTESL